MAAADVFALLLGVAQDAGVPQAGCRCPRCLAALEQADFGEQVVSLGLVDGFARKTWLIDATPDIRQQLHDLSQAAPGCKLSGILLTHAHMGHYSGLVHLGREAANPSALPVWCTRRMAVFLDQNEPWHSLFANKNLRFERLEAGVEYRLSDQLAVEALPVPHRGEFSDTVAFVVRGPDRQLLFCPDIDAWELWDQDIRQLTSLVDYSLLDATFFDEDELPGRSMKEIPHPLAKHTARLLDHPENQVSLVHLNHTNPLLGPGAARDWIESRGLGVGVHLQHFPL